MDQIILPSIEFLGCYGVGEAERSQPQPFRVRVELTTDVRKAAASDSLEDTINYAALYRQVKAYGEQHSFCLLETLADRLAQLVLTVSGAARARVTVEKQQARDGELVFPAQVQVERQRL